MWQKGKRVVRLFGLWPAIALAQSLWPCTFRSNMRDGGRTRTRTRENANAKGERGMGMGNGLLSSFGAWPGPKRPVKVIGKVTEIVAHSTLGAGQ